jgi:YVTN family beta-propeller protein
MTGRRSLLLLACVVVCLPVGLGTSPVHPPILTGAGQLPSDPAGTLLSVSVAPSPASVSIGGSLPLSPTPTCAGGPCPAGVSYGWKLSAPLGNLSYNESNTVVSSIVSSGEIPAGIAYDSWDEDLYVTNDNVFSEYTNSNLTVISGATNAVVGTIPVGSSPAGIAFDPDNGDLYVADCGSNNVSVIDPSTGSQVASVAVSMRGCTIGAKMYMNFAPVAFDPADGTVWISGYATGRVNVLDTTSDTVVASIPVGGEPYDMAYDPVNRYMYVTELNVEAVSAVNATTDQVVEEIPTGVFPSGVTYDSANGDIYVADAGIWVKNPQGFGNITVIDAATGAVVSTIFIRGYPWFVRYDPTNGCIYETDSNSTVLKVISGTTNTVVASVAIGPELQGTSTDFEEVYDPANGEIYTTGINHNTITAVDGVSPSNVFSAGGRPGNLTLTVNASWNGVTVTSAPVPVEIVSSPVPVIVAYRASPSVVAVGGTSYLNISAAGGSLPLSYAYTGLPPGCESDDASSLSCVPEVAGSFEVRSFVNDSAGHSASATLPLAVYEIPPGPSIVSFGADPNTVPLGTSTNLTVRTTGGTGPLTYFFSGLPRGCATVDAPVLTCHPTQLGAFTVVVQVNDSAGRSSEAPTLLSVVDAASGTLEIQAFQIDPPSIPLGASVLFDVTTVGGSGDLTYTYVDLPAGCASVDSPLDSCEPASTGNFTVRVFINDTRGESVNTTSPLKVSPLLPGPTIYEFAANPSTVVLGSSTEFQVETSGDANDQAFSYSGLPPGCASYNSPFLPCTPEAVGSFLVNVVVSEFGLRAVNASVRVMVVLPAPPPPEVASQPSLGAGGVTTYAGPAVIVGLGFAGLACWLGRKDQRGAPAEARGAPPSGARREATPDTGPGDATTR